MYCGKYTNLSVYKLRKTWTVLKFLQCYTNMALGEVVISILVLPFNSEYLRRNLWIKYKD